MPLASTHSTSAEQRTPLYRQIADAIRGQIADGTLAPGAPLPSEQSLMQQFGVSRGTIRQARAALRASGVIGGSQGRTFSVLGDSLTQPFDEFVSVTSWLRSIGKTPGAIVLCQDKGLAGDEAAARILRRSGKPVFLAANKVDNEKGESDAAALWSLGSRAISKR